MPEVELTQGTVHYRDEGSGQAVVLIHGLLVDAAVWDRLVPSLGVWC
jgi:pimeloyl-ACP methyl ester carboxylesterase